MLDSFCPESQVFIQKTLRMTSMFRQNVILITFCYFSLIFTNNTAIEHDKERTKTPCLEDTDRVFLFFLLGDVDGSWLVHTVGTNHDMCLIHNSVIRAVSRDTEIQAEVVQIGNV